MPIARRIALAQDTTPLALSLARSLNRTKFGDLPPTAIKHGKMILARVLVQTGGSVATSNLLVGDGPARMAVRISGGQLEQVVEELILTPNIGPAHPSNLSLPEHVDHFITLNRSSRGLEFSESLLGVHSSFHGAMVLLAMPESPFLLSTRDRGGIKWVPNPC